MSEVTTTLFLERVAEWIDDHEGMSYISKHAEALLDAQDYETLKTFMSSVDASLSQDHFRNYNLIEATDVY